MEREEVVGGEELAEEEEETGRVGASRVGDGDDGTSEGRKTTTKCNCKFDRANWR